MKISLTFLIILLGSALSSPAPAVKKGTDLYPFGEAVGDKETPKDDDGTSEVVWLSQPFTFYGKKYDNLIVNNNGLISFNGSFPKYTPDAIPMDEKKHLVAPFWGDTDNTRGGNIYYRQTTDPEVLARIDRDINGYFPDAHFKPTWAFIATWDKVEFYGSESDKVNTFQAILTSSDKAAYILFLYHTIQWTTGTASGGNPYSGLGGTPAQAGFDSGDGKNYFSIPGSRTDEILNIQSTSNVNDPGRWVFPVDNFKVVGIPEEVLQKMKEAEAARKAEKAAKKAAKEAAKKAEEEAAKKAAEEAAKKAEEEAAKKAAEEAAKKAEEEAAKKAAEEAAKKAAEEAAKKAAEEAAKKAEEEAAKKAEEEAAKKAAEEAAKKAEEEAAKKAAEEAAKKAAEEAAKKAEEEAAKKAAEEAAKKAEEEAAKKAAEEAAKKAEEEAAKKAAEEAAKKAAEEAAKKAEEEAAKKAEEEAANELEKSSKESRQDTPDVEEPKTQKIPYPDQKEEEEEEEEDCDEEEEDYYK